MTGENRKAHRRPLRSLGQWTSVLLCVILALVLLGAATVFWSWSTSSELQLWLSIDPRVSGSTGLIGLIFATVLLVGGAVVLVVYYRKQRDREDRRVAEVFQIALHNLGSKEGQIRVAGVYEVVKIADEHLEYKEEIVKILCGYLRQNILNDAPVQDIVIEEMRKHLLVGQDRVVRKSQLWCDLPFNLKNVIFRADVCFDNAVFMNQVDFSGSKFKRRAEFKGVTFGSSTSFRGVVFAGGAWFRSVAFAEAAGFEGAAFGGAAWFRDATFGGAAGFERTTFEGAAWFEGATFTGSAGFELARFGRDAGFERATFGGDAKFKGATFGGSTWFKGATFGESAGFEDAGFAGSTGFAGARYDENTHVSFAGTALLYKIPDELGMIQLTPKQANEIEDLIGDIEDELSTVPPRKKKIFQLAEEIKSIS